MSAPARRAARSPTAPAGATPSVLRRRMRRFVTIFAICLLLGFGLLRAPWAEPAVSAFTHGLVTASAAIVNFSGGRAAAREDVMQSPAGGFAVRMANGCNGVHVMILLWSAMLAFPASWKQKMLGLLAGSLAIHAVNLVRFISLFYLGQYSQAWFDFAHTYFWESLIVLDTLVIFWFWAHLVFRSAAKSNAGG